MNYRESQAEYARRVGEEMRRYERGWAYRTNFPIDGPMGLFLIWAGVGLGAFVFILLVFTGRFLLTGSGLAVTFALVTGLVCMTTHSLIVRRAQRRLRRYHNGLCIRCGYDIRASAERCPECGELVYFQRGERLNHVPPPHDNGLREHPDAPMPPTATVETPVPREAAAKHGGPP